MREIIHQFLKYLPALPGGMIALAIAASSTWPKVKLWVEDQATWAWSQMTDPWKFWAIIAFFIIYGAAIILTGNKAAKEPAPKFRVSFNSVGMNGTPTGTPLTYSVYAILRVANIGTLPSALDQWHMLVVASGRTIMLEKLHQAQYHLSTDAHKTVTYSAADTIYTKTLKPVTVGEICDGLLFGISQDAAVGNLKSGDQIIVVCHDAFGSVYEVEWTHTNLPPEDLLHYAGVNPTITPTDKGIKAWKA